MLLQLPRELQEAVYRRLNASDRARLNLAVPRASRFAADKKRERKLGILASAFKKKRATKLSNAMRYFLATVPKWDVTVTEMAEHVPEVAAVERKDQGEPSVLDRLSRGQATAADAPAILQLEGPAQGEFFASCSPTTFAALYDESPEIARAVRGMLDDDNSRSEFAFAIINRGNGALLSHMLQDHERYALPIEAFRSYLTNGDNVKRWCSYVWSRKVLFAHFEFPPALVQEMYDAALDAVDVDAMLFYESQRPEAFARATPCEPKLLNTNG